MSGTPSIKKAFNAQIKALAARIKTDPTSCYSEAIAFKGQNYSRDDIVYALAKAVIDADLTPAKMEVCLTSEYGPAAIKTQYWVRNGPHNVTANAFPTHFDPAVAFDSARADQLIYAIKHFSGNSTLIDPFFAPQVSVRDLSDLDLTGRFSDQQIFKKLKDKSYDLFGCPYDPKDAGYFDDKRRSASLFLLAVQSQPAATPTHTYKVTDALLLVLWWEGAVSSPKISEIVLTQRSDIESQILKQSGNVCATNMRFEKAAD